MASNTDATDGEVTETSWIYYLANKQNAEISGDSLADKIPDLEPLDESEGETARLVEAWL